MSIEKRAGPFSRSFRSLIKTRAALAKTIKDLKDLRILRGRACYRHSGPTDLRDVFFVGRGPRMPHAHASGFPPRSLDCADAGEGQALALR